METPCRCTSAVHQHGGRKRVATSGVHFGYLKRFLIFAESHAHFSYHFGCSDLKNTGRIAVFMYVIRFSAAIYVTHCQKRQILTVQSIFKTKHATKLTTYKQVYFQYVFYVMKIKTKKTVYFVILCFYVVTCPPRIPT